MKRYAFIQNNRVIDIVETDKNLNEVYPQEFIDFLIEINSDYVQVGWFYYNEQFSSNYIENVKTIEQLREIAWERIKSERDNQEFTTFTWNNFVFDATKESQNRIVLAILGAQLAISVNQEWTVEWRLANNSLITINAEQMIQIGLAMGDNTLYAHEHANQLRTLIQNAFTQEELDNIVW